MIKLKSIVLVFLLLALAPAAHAVKVNVAWEYQDFPAKIELFEAKPEFRNTISKTGTFPVGKPDKGVAFSKKWRSSSFNLKPGSSRPFVLVVTNSSEKDLFFFATPHLVHPEHATLGHHFECLCNHSIFHVPPKSVWYRVVRLQLWPDYKHEEMKLLHTIVGVPAQDANGKFKDRLYRE